MYAKNKLKTAIQAIKSQHDDLLWLKLRKENFNLQQDIYLCVVYAIPENSVSTAADPFDILSQEISEFSAKGQVLLGGDFNSRTGALKDFIELDTNKYGNTDQSDNLDIFNCRSSQDKKNNASGSKLIDLCTTNRLKILNCRTLGDLTGKFTCFKKHGNSVVDYMLCPENLINKASNFQVLPLSLLLIFRPCSTKTKIKTILS